MARKKKGFGYGGENTSFSQKLDEELTVKEISQFPITGIPEKNIKEETCRHFQVRTWFSEATGEVKGHCFPVTTGGKLKGYIIRKLNPKNKYDKWKTVGDCGVHNQLLGQYQAEKSCSRKKLFIAEGPTDTLTAFQVLTEKNPEYAHLINVVGIGFGTKNAVDHIANNQEFLSQYQNIITCFDNDQATEEERRKGILKGRDATSAVHLYLGGEGYYAKLDLNDLNDYLEIKRQEDLYWRMMKPEKWQHSKVIQGCPVSIEDMMTPLPQGTELKFAPKLSRMLKGFRPHELTILMSVPKCGKTTNTKMMAWEFLSQGESVCCAFLEDTERKVAQSFAALEADVKLSDYREDPSKFGEDVAEKAKALLDKSVQMITTQKGHISPEECIKLLEFSCQKGAKIIIFDHLSYLLSGEDISGGEERKAIDKLLHSLVDLKKRYPVHIIAVSHIVVDKARLAKAKSFACNKDSGEQEKSYWYITESGDARGSGAFAQLCDNLISIDKEYTVSGERGKTQLVVHYNREGDITGRADTLIIPYGKGRLEAVEDY